MSAKLTTHTFKLDIVSEIAGLFKSKDQQHAYPIMQDAANSNLKIVANMKTGVLQCKN